MSNDTVPANGEAMPTIPAIFARWQAAQAQLDASKTDDEAGAAIDAQKALKPLIAPLMPATAAEFGMKLLIDTNDGLFEHEQPLIEQARFLAGMQDETAAAALDRLTMQAAQILRENPALNIERIIIIPQGVYMARSIAGFSAAANMAGTDPLLQAIQAYRDGAAAYNEAMTDDDDANDELAERTYVPSLISLEAWTDPALTQQEAVEALRFALTEAGHFGLSETVRPMLRAALGYFDGKTLSTQEDRT